MMREDRKRAEQRQKKMARRKREVRRMKRKLYKAGILAAAGIIVLAVILMLCGSGNAKKSAKKTSSAKTETSLEFFKFKALYNYSPELPLFPDLRYRSYKIPRKICEKK